MKVLTSSSCSKAIAESLGSHLCHRRGGGVAAAAHVPDRVEFCFSLRSRNDKRGCSFLLLNKKGVSPIHAVPPKTEVDLESSEPNLEPVEPQPQQSEQTNESKHVHVTFQLRKNCYFGEQFLIVGDDPMLGSWDPLEALPMTWSDGHIWTVDLDIPAGNSIQYKFILKGKAGEIVWQPGTDRIISISENMNRLIVIEDWEKAELQQIIEEDQIVQSNEELQVVSETSTLTENWDFPKEELVSSMSEASDLEASQSQTHDVENPITEEPEVQNTSSDSTSYSMEKPLPIVAENIGSFEDFGKSISYENNISNIQLNEESADSSRNDHTSIIHNLVHDGNAEPLMDDEATIAESKLFELESAPVLVPGLELMSEEEGPNDDIQERTRMETSSETSESKDGEVQERTTMETSSEAFELKDQIKPEFSKEQESDNGAPQEIIATIKDEPHHHYNEYEQHFHLEPLTEDGSNPQPHDVDGNVLQNDIQWGRETVKKFLTKLGLI
ncbi:hypothetical protein PIB30_007635 [Stylosanthes scabra]|uniref:CBM20 domain-containing protein n=2 Tax=Stylosanthes scabra TaxID=79078 RepID=A0ABU6V410_9FABA|nr:hypothetical protein [Stylosanthes scabra]